jgi:hypothetical protein
MGTESDPETALNADPVAGVLDKLCSQVTTLSGVAVQARQFT